MLDYLLKVVPNCIGDCEDGGNWRVDLSDGSSRYATDDEIKSARRLSLTDQINDITALKVATVFGFAQKDINLVIKEINLTAASLQLVYKGLSTPLTAEESAFILDTQSKFAKVEAYRAHGRSLIASMLLAEDLATFDITSGWPE